MGALEITLWQPQKLIDCKSSLKVKIQPDSFYPEDKEGRFTGQGVTSH